MFTATNQAHFSLDIPDIRHDFKVGGSFIKLDASGVPLVGPSVKMNSRGRPAAGSGAAPLLPGDVLAADSEVAGAVLARAQRQALQKATPLCAICNGPEKPRATI